MEKSNSSVYKKDLGYKDNYRGWYDINNCGDHNVYCRWVGNNGSGGNPSIKTQQGSSWWSCSVGDEPYSKPGYFGNNFNFNLNNISNKNFEINYNIFLYIILKLTLNIIYNESIKIINNRLL